jgi:hypothetical protein
MCSSASVSFLCETLSFFVVRGTWNFIENEGSGEEDLVVVFATLLFRLHADEHRAAVGKSFKDELVFARLAGFGFGEFLEGHGGRFA